MPSSNGKNDEKIIQAVKSGKLSETELDMSVRRILELIDKAEKGRKKNYKYDEAQHHLLSKEAAQKSCVLLKNEGILPLSKNDRILVVGEFAKLPRYQGAGSSLINPWKVDTALEAFDEAGVDYEYADGYSIKTSKPDKGKIEQAVKMAKSARKVIIFAGLTEDYESEGYDRARLGLPDNQNELIKNIAAANSNTAIVLQNGAPVTMPWVHDVKGILECYLGGQAGSSAAVDILLGKVNPSGKLAETFPFSLEENPSYNYFPGGPKTVEYRESIYVGYRYYDKARKEVLFSFGHGLSYTKFEYSNLVVKKRDEFEYDVVVTIKNIGDVFGSEIIQLYVKNNESPVFKAEKELKGFAKVDLRPGEEKKAEFKLDKRSFAYYDVKTDSWRLDTGEYAILLGASSRDIRLSYSVDIKSALDIASPYNEAELSKYYNLGNENFTVDDEQFSKLMGKKIPRNYIDKNAKIDRSATLYDIQHTLVGKILHISLMKEIRKRVTDESGEVDERSLRLFEATVAEMPLRAIEMMGGNSVQYYFAEGIVEIVNGRFFYGLSLLLKKEKR